MIVLHYQVKQHQIEMLLLHLIQNKQVQQIKKYLRSKNPNEENIKIREGVQQQQRKRSCTKTTKNDNDDESEKILTMVTKMAQKTLKIGQM